MTTNNKIMKKITPVLMLFAALVNAQVQNYKVGDVVDDFTVIDTNGGEHNLYSYLADGKYVYLDFFFDTCAPCEITTPIFNEFYDKYGCGEGDVICISMNNGTDTNAEVEAFQDMFGGPFNHAPAISSEGGAGDVDNNFGILAYPTFCLIGPDNTLLENQIGMMVSDINVALFESTFPTGFEPPVLACSLGISDASTFDFTLYPTVSNGSFTIGLSEEVRSQVTIYDFSGKLIFYGNYDSRTVQLDLTISAGTYFVSIASEYGSATKTIIFK